MAEREGLQSITGNHGLDLSRRDLLLALGSSCIFPAACSAQPAPVEFTPEAFGAKGDGVSDDYDALMRMVHAVNAAGGGTVGFERGRTYFLNRYRTAADEQANLAFSKCSGLALYGNGASIAVKGDFHRDARSTRSLAGLVFEDCRRVAVHALELVGNVGATRRSLSIKEGPSHGLIFGGCFDVVIDGVTSRHFAGDGLYIRQGRSAPAGVRPACRRFTVRNSRFLFNARQGMSVIQLRGGQFENCDFSYTGYIAPETRGPYGFHAPGAGVDVEPNHSPSTDGAVDVMTGDLRFQNCRMIGNRGTSFIACKYGRRGPFLEQISLESCQFQCDEDGDSRYGFIFDADGEVRDCTLQMRQRTAFIGWSPLSDARPRFSGNEVHGRNIGPGHPLLRVRKSGGVPIIEGNRFIVPDATALNGAAGRSVIVVDNPNAIVRDNRILTEQELLLNRVGP